MFKKDLTKIIVESISDLKSHMLRNNENNNPSQKLEPLKKYLFVYDPRDLFTLEHVLQNFYHEKMNLEQFFETLFPKKSTSNSLNALKGYKKICIFLLINKALDVEYWKDISLTLKKTSN